MDGKSRWILALAVGALAGCGGGGSQPLSQQRFAAQPADTISAPVERPGPILYNQVRVDLTSEVPRVEVLEMKDDGPADAAVGEVSSTVQQQVRSPREAVLADPATPAPSTQPQAGGDQPIASGYYTIGGVVAEVNGQPIFANRVIGILGRLLQARAQETTLEQFEVEARELITRQVWELVRAELEFAAAQRSLSPADQLLADAMTMTWRDRRITEAGGSLQQAIQRAQLAGEDFDTLLQEQYRTFMTQVYYQKRVIPRIQITADDMRAYYDRHREDQFTQRAEARFRLIKIDPARMETREAALDRITTMKRQVESGAADFATLASQINHDNYLAQRGGDVGMIQRGAYAIPEVEQAVWDTPEGKVTDVITARNAYYLALVEQKREGRVQQFEEEQVQDTITQTLRAEQFRELREQFLQRLQQQAIIRVDPKMLEIAVEMAIQNYPQWRQAGK